MATGDLVTSAIRHRCSGSRPSSAVVTVGTELTTGLRQDTNSGEIACALTAAGYAVVETSSVPDELDAVSALLARLVAGVDLVITTGGLGPTHDDITREAAAAALGLTMSRDSGIEASLARLASRHAEPDAVAQLTRQADVLSGATVIAPTTGTAPGQIVPTARGDLVMLPGPPAEMRPMLASTLAGLAAPGREPNRILAVVGLPESDVQVRVQRALTGTSDVGFTVLARLGEVHAVLSDEGAGATGLAQAAARARTEIGDACFSDDGSSLAEVVLAGAREAGMTLGTAESCTGGMVAASLTDVAGASDVFAGAVVCYSNAVKTSMLGVPAMLISGHGAVSSEVATAMARGARTALACDLAVAVTGVAGPGGGSADKPVGTVWFAIADADRAYSELRELGGDRVTVRARATVHALDMLRRRLAKMAE